MEVQNHPDPNEVSDEKIAEQVMAKPGGKYPIRLLHLIHGELIIGYVIAVFAETTMVLRPFTIEARYNPEKETIEEYDFEPYLDQMVYYDPHDLSPIPFMNGAVISITRPAQHVIDNYTSIVQLREAVDYAEEGKKDIQIYKRSYYDPKTRH